MAEKSTKGVAFKSGQVSGGYFWKCLSDRRTDFRVQENDIVLEMVLGNLRNYLKKIK